MKAGKEPGRKAKEYCTFLGEPHHLKGEDSERTWRNNPHGKHLMDNIIEITCRKTLDGKCSTEDTQRKTLVGKRLTESQHSTETMHGKNVGHAHCTACALCQRMSRRREEISWPSSPGTGSCTAFVLIGRAGRHRLFELPTALAKKSLRLRKRRRRGWAKEKSYLI